MPVSMRDLLGVVAAGRGHATSTPGGVFLDTFTAADSTDPTTRDVDTHPAITGAARWRFDTGAPSEPGAINSNRLEPTSVSVGAFSPILFLYGNGNEDLFTLPFFAYLKGKADDGYARFVMYSAGAAYADMQIGLVGGTSGGAGGETNSFYSSNQMLAAGEHQIGVYISVDTVALIADGAVLESSSQDFSDADPINFLRVECPSTSTAANTSIDSVAVYTGLTLSDAIALTT